MKVYLRVGVKGGGCSGFSYTLDLTETVSEEDETWSQHGVDVVCDPKSLLYLQSLKLLQTGFDGSGRQPQISGHASTAVGQARRKPSRSR